MEHIVDHGSLIEALGGAAAIETKTGFKAVTIGAWKAKGRIANEAWEDFISLAASMNLRSRGGEVIDANWLLKTMKPRGKMAPVRAEAA